MKALTIPRYGPPERLVWQEVPRPTAAPDGCVIRVEAVGLNPYDWHIYRADPWIVRLAYGLRGPHGLVMGADVCGIVEEVGPDVQGITVGQRVAATLASGAAAEYAAVPSDRAAVVPATVDPIVAAATPMAALTALQGLEGAQVDRGARVLVIGASGGVGHMAVQIARALGARRVVAVASGSREPMLTALGADRVIDYRSESVRECGEQFDLIYDTVATDSLMRLRGLLSEDGVYAPAGAVGGGPLLGPAWAMVRSRVQAPLARRRAAPVTARGGGSGPDLARVMAWIADGTLTTVVQDTWPVSRAAEALRVLEAGHVGGKVVLTVP